MKGTDAVEYSDIEQNQTATRSMYGEDDPSYDTEALARMGVRGIHFHFAAIAPRSNPCEETATEASLSR
jgi:hypothetical protein